MITDQLPRQVIGQRANIDHSSVLGWWFSTVVYRKPGNGKFKPDLLWQPGESSRTRGRCGWRCQYQPSSTQYRWQLYNQSDYRRMCTWPSLNPDIAISFIIFVDVNRYCRRVYMALCERRVGEFIRRSLIAPLRGATIRHKAGSVASRSDQGNTLHSLS